MPYADPEKQRTANRKSYAKHKDEWAPTRKAWVVSNHDKCAEYGKTYGKTYRKKEKSLASQRRRHLRKFNITLEQYEQRALQQENACAICGSIPDKRLAVDHDHSTGAVRGLLCFSCNIGLGYFKDSPELLEIALVYLENSKRSAIHGTF